MAAYFFPVQRNALPIDSGFKCLICRLEMEDGEWLTHHKVGKAFHVFHYECLTQWKDATVSRGFPSTCPSCCKKFTIMESQIDVADLLIDSASSGDLEALRIALESNVLSWDLEEGNPVIDEWIGRPLLRAFFAACYYGRKEIVKELFLHPSIAIDAKILLSYLSVPGLVVMYRRAAAVMLVAAFILHL